MLSANELGDVADWYLLPKGDIRSSYALEVAANKYTELPRHRSPSSKGTASQILAPIACDWRRSSKSLARTNKSGPGAFGLSGLEDRLVRIGYSRQRSGTGAPKGTKFHIE